ncbi:hypothetical protein B484DRAFT_454512, partial [Ochromonadaceae sp. CCMP2298]
MVLVGLVLLLAALCCAEAYMRADVETLTNAMNGIHRSLDVMDEQRVKNEDRFLVVYHIGDPPGSRSNRSNSIDISLNNMNLFVAAILSHHNDPQSPYKAYYLFNIVGDADNPIIPLIPTHLPTVSYVLWSEASSDLDCHMRLTRKLGDRMITRFGAVLYMNQGVRGPLVDRVGGQWLGRFKGLLGSHNVAMAGPSMSCEVSPHVQTHMFALRSQMVPKITAHIRESMTGANLKDWTKLIHALEVGMTGVVQAAGFNVSSFLYANRDQPYFKHCLTYQGPKNQFDLNPASWCGVSIQELVFVKWGGEPMRTPGMICNSTVVDMENALENISQSEVVDLVLPEALMGGSLFPLYKEYAREAWLDRKPLPAPPAPPASTPSPNVCFLVRTLAQLPTWSHNNPNSALPLLNSGLNLLITTLLRQTNPHWKAFFYPIDSTHRSTIDALLSVSSDHRMETVGLPPQAYDPLTAGYPATDAVLRAILQQSPECAWISVTTSDNSYGSEVVSRVLAAANPSSKRPQTSKYYPKKEAVPDMIISPMDSRRFLQLDLHNRRRFMGAQEVQLEDYCSLLSGIEQTSFTYAFRAVPQAGK